MEMIEQVLRSDFILPYDRDRDEGEVGVLGAQQKHERSTGSMHAFSSHLGNLCMVEGQKQL